MRMILLSAAALALAGLASPTLASGSGSGGGGGFGNFGGSGANSQNRELERLYRKGRSQVRKHITCKDCEYHNQLTKSNARQVAREVINGKFDLNENNRTAVLIYLRDRYDL